MLSICNWIKRPEASGAKHKMVLKAAFNSRALMCSSFSDEIQGPPAPTPSQKAPQPEREASENMIMSGARAEKGLPFT